MLGDKISVFRRRIDVMRLAIGNLTFRKLRSTINRVVAGDQLMKSAIFKPSQHQPTLMEFQRKGKANGAVQI